MDNWRCSQFVRANDGYDLFIEYLRRAAHRGLPVAYVDRTPTTFRSLTRREDLILQMIALGMSNKCIAQWLGISPETVKSHVKAIFSKLKSRTRAQAVARADAVRLMPKQPEDRHDHRER